MTSSSSKLVDHFFWILKEAYYSQNRFNMLEKDIRCLNASLYILIDIFKCDRIIRLYLDLFYLNFSISNEQWE